MKCSINGSEERRAKSEKRKPLGPFFCFSLFALSCRAVRACPFCSDNVATGMAKGFYWSILLMLAVPFLVVGTIAGVLWRTSRPPLGRRDSPYARLRRAVGAGRKKGGLRDVRRG